MQDRLDLLGSRSLKNLTLPASHDSAMYLTSFPQSLARTQNLSIYNQLAQGVRYFDLRPRWKASANRIVIFHGPIDGPDLSTVLDDVHRFMNQGHRELVILKFSHYDGFDPQQLCPDDPADQRPAFAVVSQIPSPIRNGWLILLSGIFWLSTEPS